MSVLLNSKRSEEEENELIASREGRVELTVAGTRARNHLRALVTYLSLSAHTCVYTYIHFSHVSRCSRFSVCFISLDAHRSRRGSIRLAIVGPRSSSV